MDAVAAARLRRQWPIAAAIGVGVLFFAVHATVFRPLAAHYRQALAKATTLGLPVDPAHPSGPAPLSPRVFNLLIDNSLPAHDADERAASGALAAEMVQNLSALAAKHDLEIEAAEPGVLTQQTGSLELRAHLRMHGTYAGFVGLLDDLAFGGRLWLVERFRVLPRDHGRLDIDLWVSSCILKRTGVGA